MFFGIIGFIWTLLEIYLNIFNPNDVAVRSFIKDNVFWIVISLSFICLVSKLPVIRTSKIISNSDVQIEVEFCDIFEQEGAIIIPIMDTFDNDILNDLVNPNTLHGKFITKYYHNNPHQLDEDINFFLNTNKIVPVEIDHKLKGKKNKYQIGTVVLVKTPDQKTFLLSVTTKMKASGNVEPHPDYIEEFLTSVWNNISEYGIYNDTINIPVIGTFISRLPSRYTHQFILFEIIDAFVEQCKAKTVCKNLRVCLYKDNFNHYDMSSIDNFLDYITKYK